MTWLNDMRILAALAIIFVHVSQVSLNLPEDINSIAWWTSNLYLSFSLWGVPVFVMISGALLLSPSREYPTLSSFYLRRVNRMLVPLMFWTIFYLFWSYLKSVVGARQGFDFEQMLSDIFSGRPYPHMWYLYMVFGLYVFTPYLRKVVKHSTELELLFLSLILLFISMISAASGTTPHRATIFIQLFPLYLGYFFAGHLIFNSTITIKTQYLLSLFILFALLTAAGHYLETAFYSGKYFYQNFSITIVPMSIFLMFLIKNIHHNIPINPDVRKNLAVFSLGAYLIHPAVFDVINALHYFGFNPQTYAFLMIPMTVFCITLSSMLIAYAFSKLPLLKKTI